MAHPSRLERRPPHGEPPRRDVDDPAPPRHPLSAQLLAIAVLSLVLAALAGAPLQFAPELYRAGDVAREDVKATRDFLYPDPEATEQHRRAAEEQVPAVYDLDSAAAQEVLDRWAPNLELLLPDVAGPDGPRLPDWVGLERELAARWGVAVSRSRR